MSMPSEVVMIRSIFAIAVVLGLCHAADPEPSSTRTVERSPDGGFPYRLHIGVTAGKAQPHRLVVWLHPSNGAHNELPESLIETFSKHRLALLTVLTDQIRGWSSDDLTMLFERTVPDAATIEGVSAERPVLFGYSAGGQASLGVWTQKPDQVGALILDAAYPVNVLPGNKIELIGNPPAKRPIPVLALVGELDPNARTWTDAAPAWKNAGIPLTVRRVAGKRHEWLFDAAEIQALDAWLTTVEPSVGAIAPAQPTDERGSVP
jgi:pimeloyl-ACP methyl ester carboxylesterase